MKHKGIKKFFKILFIYIPISFILITLSWVLLLKWVPVYVTPLMIQRSISYYSDPTYHTYKRWRSLDELSPNIVKAVIAGEDNKFFDHHGFDFVEIDKALKAKKKGKRLRGASTISQQTAKNVFLFPSRSWIRKGFEAYFTSLIELIWGKQRIMEVYLNVAEMGKGIFGAEAAAERLFHTKGKLLTTRQSALIAATLPNPLKRKANAPSAYVSKRAIEITVIMRTIAYPKEWKKKNNK
jgi:monofunctional biosynthetic peptidoglycan transglycosylase